MKDESLVGNKWRGNKGIVHVEEFKKGLSISFISFFLIYQIPEPVRLSSPPSFPTPFPPHQQQFQT
jgi:hypothetical protein